MLCSHRHGIYQYMYIVYNKRHSNLLTEMATVVYNTLLK